MNLNMQVRGTSRPTALPSFAKSFCHAPYQPAQRKLRHKEPRSDQACSAHELLIAKLKPLKRSVVCHASAAKDGAEAEVPSSGILDMVVLGLLFGCWYLSNIVFNIYNKQVLKVFPFPMTCTTVQFMVGTILALTCWATGLVKRPNVSQETVLKVLPLAVVHTLGNLLTNVSLGAVAVSFTHTIKAMEPIFSVALCSIFLGDFPHPLVLLTLIPIMGGVALASMSEATFNWYGFGAAMGSNLTFQSRNVLSKKLMLKGSAPQPTSSSNGVAAEVKVKAPTAGLDNINLFAIITCLSFLILLPINFLVEGWNLTPAKLTAMGVVDPTEVLTRTAICGLCFHLYQQVSYMILARVSPVTHSIGNCVKRVVVIVASVCFFRNPMTTQSAAGTAVALLGVFAYSQAKRLTAAKAKPKAA